MQRMRPYSPAAHEMFNIYVELLLILGYLEPVCSRTVGRTRYCSFFSNDAQEFVFWTTLPHTACLLLVIMKFNIANN